MQQPAELELNLAAGLILVVLAVSSLVAWVVIGSRAAAGQPVVPYQPRRPVPWRGIEVLFLLVFYFLAPGFFAQLALVGLRERPFENAVAVQQGEVPAEAKVVEEKKEETTDKSHVVMRLLRERRDPGVLILVILTAAVVAPIVEEFSFRLLLQGWLETVERRLRRRVPLFRRRPGMMPVAVASLVFALLHVRIAGPPIDLRMLTILLASMAVVSTFFLLGSGFVLRVIHGATAEDFGIVREMVGSDIRLGLLTLLAVAGPIYATSVIASGLAPDNIAADPLPIFILSVALGALYYRTHRILPAIVLHMAFNATSLLMALLALP